MSKLTVGQILKDVIKSKCQMSGKQRISYIFDFDFKFLNALNEISRYAHFGIYGN